MSQMGADGSDANASRAMSQAVSTRLNFCFCGVRSLGFGAGWVAEGFQPRLVFAPESNNPSAHLVRPYDGFIFGNGPCPTSAQLGRLGILRDDPEDLRFTFGRFSAATVATGLEARHLAWLKYFLRFQSGICECRKKWWLILNPQPGKRACMARTGSLRATIRSPNIFTPVLFIVPLNPHTANVT